MTSVYLEALIGLEAGWTPTAGGTVEEPPPPPPPDPEPGDRYAVTMLGKKPTSATTTALTGMDLTGSSGGFASRLHWASDANGVVLVHSDRRSYVYYLGLTSAGGYLPIKKAFQLTGLDITAGPNQWEDSAYDVLNSKGWVANCGGGQAQAAKINQFQAFHFTEPASLATPGTVGSLPVDTYWFKYPGSQVWDCETMLCDPIKGQFFVLTKEPVGTADLFAAPRTLTKRTSGGTQRNDLTPLQATKFPGRRGNYTGGDFSPDGTDLLVRNNNTKGDRFSVQRDSAGWITGVTFVESFDLPALPNKNGVNVTAETLFYEPDGVDFIVGAEGDESPLARMVAP